MQDTVFRAYSEVRAFTSPSELDEMWQRCARMEIVTWSRPDVASGAVSLCTGHSMLLNFPFIALMLELDRVARATGMLS